MDAGSGISIGGLLSVNLIVHGWAGEGTVAVPQRVRVRAQQLAGYRLPKNMARFLELMLLSWGIRRAMKLTAPWLPEPQPLPFSFVIVAIRIRSCAILLGSVTC